MRHNQSSLAILLSLTSARAFSVSERIVCRPSAGSGPDDETGLLQRRNNRAHGLRAHVLRPRQRRQCGGTVPKEPAEREDLRPGQISWRRLLPQPPGQLADQRAKLARHPGRVHSVCLEFPGASRLSVRGHFRVHDHKLIYVARLPIMPSQDSLPEAVWRRRLARMGTIIVRSPI